MPIIQIKTIKFLKQTSST